MRCRLCRVNLLSGLVGCRVLCRGRRMVLRLTLRRLIVIVLSGRGYLPVRWSGVFGRRDTDLAHVVGAASS